ncbi:Armadillo repeat-containing protein 3 [Mycena venus]|uniref:Armadillo repeat-containing protein 3 n=1 Tax=Mycena venus TaxID=2733690 RepID=A0A8H7CU15_9AGAR|nr:Armadillo repeat-containing protein 3 [Mycena venus]
MPPLYTRPPSIYSWWSDSNSAVVHGPTINLHAAAKPLMRRMYHRQALALIKKNRGKPLSGTTLEIYTSYFQWDFVLWSTKAAIFEDLANRAESKVDEARAVVDSPDFCYITQMLKSPDIGARISSCKLLKSLACHRCTMEAILELRTCVQLVSMLRDEGSGVVEGAVLALSNIASLSLDGAQVIVDAGALSHVSDLLESPSSNIRKWTCVLAGNLAAHDLTRAAVLALKLYMQIVPLLSDEGSGVVRGAAHALSQIALSMDGAQAVVDAGALGHLMGLLQSSDSTIRKWTCLLVGNLADHQPTLATVLALKPYESLVSLLSDQDSGVVERAVYALWRITHSLEGAQAVVNAGALVLVLELLQSPGPHIRKWTCRLVGSLASHQSTSPASAVLELWPCKQLVTLLRDEDCGVVEWAAYALSQIARPVEAIDARVLDFVQALLESPSPGVRKWTCLLVGNLTCHEFIRSRVLALKPYTQIVHLLADQDSGVVDGAVHALSQAAQSLDGAQAIVDARGLDHLSGFLRSPSLNIRRWTCQLLCNVAAHEPIRATVVALKPFEMLVTLLRDEDSEVVNAAVHALSQISRSLDGAQAIVDAEALDRVSVLFKSPRLKIRKWTCALMGTLAWHESIRAVVLALKPFKTLVSLLSDEDSEVVDWAAYALSLIARSLDGAQPLVDAGGLDHVLALLKSPSPEIRKWTCELVGNLAWHESIRAAVLALKPFKTLVSLLSDEDSEVVRLAVYALSQIARSLDGAQPIVDAGGLDYVSTLLELPSPEIRKWTCELVGNLAWHNSTTATVLALWPFKTLVTLLRDKDYGVVEATARALSHIARSLDGAQAIVDARGLDHVSVLFESPSPKIRKWTCQLLGNLTCHNSSSTAALVLKPYESLVSLLSDENSAVVNAAMRALSQIARSLDGAQAIVHARGLDHISTLLESPDCETRKQTCELVWKLASNELTLPAILELEPSEQLVFCLRDPATRRRAIFALLTISEWPDGAAILADLNVAGKVQELIELPDITHKTVQKIRTIMDNISPYTKGIGIAL